MSAMLVGRLKPAAARGAAAGGLRVGGAGAGAGAGLLLAGGGTNFTSVLLTCSGFFSAGGSSSAVLFASSCSSFSSFLLSAATVFGTVSLDFCRSLSSNLRTSSRRSVQLRSRQFEPRAFAALEAATLMLCGTCISSVFAFSSSTSGMLDTILSISLLWNRKSTNSAKSTVPDKSSSAARNSNSACLSRKSGLPFFRSVKNSLK
mmetsp:Transcript_14741/g.34763  ORF Transcript_14741/g.34763 Transcript_14741/m.34763 type:complete len:204 (+) Transcript_14741:1029-1640(+)